jgi:hypothetical protein
MGTEWCVPLFRGASNTIVQLIHRSTLECNRSIAAPTEGSMDHNEAVRKFGHLLIGEARHAHETATELEALVPLLPSDKSRQLAQLQVRASHKQAKDFRDLAQKVKET